MELIQKTDVYLSSLATKMMTTTKDTGVRGDVLMNLDQDVLPTDRPQDVTNDKDKKAQDDGTEDGASSGENGTGDLQGGAAGVEGDKDKDEQKKKQKVKEVKTLENALQVCMPRVLRIHGYFCVLNYCVRVLCLRIHGH
jgi:hypothetical protein